MGYIPDQSSIDYSELNLVHRGPDSSGLWINSNDGVFLLHRRLSIMDLSDNGNQPMAHPDNESILIVFNGEIYNYYTLRKFLESKGVVFRSKCDTELLLHSYTLWGVQMLHHIEGMFAFAIWDGDKKICFLARDPVGQKPLFYTSNDNKFCFGSTPKSLRNISPWVSSLNYSSLCYVLTLGYVPSPFSIWDDMYSLDPGHYIIWKDGHLSSPQPFWQPPDPHIRELADPKEFVCLLSDVLGEHLLSDVPVGLLLSGGLDSSLLAALLARLGNNDVTAVTLDFINNPGSEALVAANTAKYLGFNHITSEFKQENINTLRQNVAINSSQPQGYSALLTWYQLAEKVSQSFKTVLSADGGDELFGGYSWYGSSRFNLNKVKHTVKSILDRNSLSKEFDNFSRRSQLHAHAIRVFPRFLPTEAAILFAPVGQGFCEETMLSPLERYWNRKLPLQDSLQRVDLMTFCSGSICAKTDNMSMAHSLEVRAPLLDRRIIEWAFSYYMPSYRDGENKLLIRKALKGKVPIEVMNQSKKGFSMKTKEYNFESLIDEISYSAMNRSGMLNPEWRTIVQKNSRYRDARIWTLSSLTKWYENNI